jgi:hypothetical protein
VATGDLPVSAANAQFQVAPAATSPDDMALAFDASMSAAFEGFSWQIPALALSVPGLLVVIVVLLQVLGGLAWLPLVRRRLGGVGVGRR